MAELDLQSLGARAELMINTLGSISAEPNRMVRLFLTPAHREAANLVARWMEDAGLKVSEDALGTVRGHLAGVGRKCLLIGSHIDTVIEAGIFDGPFGVIAGILAAGHFVKAGRKLPFGIDVLAFGDEEGIRFDATLASSTACAGTFNMATLQLADSEGVRRRAFEAKRSKSSDQGDRGDVAGITHFKVRRRFARRPGAASVPPAGVAGR